MNINQNKIFNKTNDVNGTKYLTFGDYERYDVPFCMQI